MVLLVPRANQEIMTPFNGVDVALEHAKLELFFPLVFGALIVSYWV